MSWKYWGQPVLVVNADKEGVRVCSQGDGKPSECPHHVHVLDVMEEPHHVTLLNRDLEDRLP